MHCDVTEPAWSSVWRISTWMGAPHQLVARWDSAWQCGKHLRFFLPPVLFLQRAPGQEGERYRKIGHQTRQQGTQLCHGTAPQTNLSYARAKVLVNRRSRICGGWGRGGRKFGCSEEGRRSMLFTPQAPKVTQIDNSLRVSRYYDETRPDVFSSNTPQKSNDLLGFKTG